MNDRDKQRLRRLDCKHANCGLPHFLARLMGKTQSCPPKSSPPLWPAFSAFPFSRNLLLVQTMNIQGVCCRRTQDTITRHNRVRNWIFKLADMGLLNPQMEKLGLLGPTDSSRRRPRDVSFPLWRYGRGLAIDVAVICPVAGSLRRTLRIVCTESEARGFCWIWV